MLELAIFFFVVFAGGAVFGLTAGYVHSVFVTKFVAKVKAEIAALEAKAAAIKKVL